MKGLVAGFLCLAVLGLAACGGSDDGSDQISADQAAEGKAVLAVAAKLKEAYRQKDPARICPLIDPQGLKKEFKGAEGCKRQLTAAMNESGAQVSAEDFSFDSVTVDGENAVASQEEGDGNQVHFKKVGGKWYVDVDPPTVESSDSSVGQ